MDVEIPTLLVNKKRVMRNIRRMAEKAQRSGVRFRPHFKTHQSAQVGEWFREFGVTEITVSSMLMAEFFAKHGWDDISVAFPVNILEFHRVNALAQKIQLNLLVESEETVNFLSKNLTSTVDVWLKIDVGYNRTGIPFDKTTRVIKLAKTVEAAENLHFAGLLTHAGHSYYAKSSQEIREIHQESISFLNRLRDLLQENGVSPVQLSIGDTPTCSIADKFSRVDEIRPGNFVFFDLKQLSLGSCREEDIGVAVACPVVAKHQERQEVVIYGGAIHFSKDFLIREDGTSMFGQLTHVANDGWGALIEDCYVSSLSQEHGIVKVNGAVFDNVRIGNILTILPVHSCLTVNLLRKYLTTEGKIIDH